MKQLGGKVQELGGHVKELGGKVQELRAPESCTLTQFLALVEYLDC